MDEYCVPNPTVITLIGRKIISSEWDKFTQRVDKAFEGLDENGDFDGIHLSNCLNITAAQFNYILEQVSQRLNGKELLYLTLESVRFASKDPDKINVDLLVDLCLKAYQFSIITCRLYSHKV